MICQLILDYKNLINFSLAAVNDGLVKHLEVKPRDISCIKDHFQENYSFYNLQVVMLFYSLLISYNVIFPFQPTGLSYIDILKSIQKTNLEVKWSCNNNYWLIFPPIKMRSNFLRILKNQHKELKENEWLFTGIRCHKTSASCLNCLPNQKIN